MSEAPSSAAPTAAILLAAGEARRMGGIDKRRLEIDGEPLVTRWIGRLKRVGVDDVVVVLGFDADRIAGLIAGSGARPVRNAQWAEGQQGSVLAGLRALQDGSAAAMIVLCDLPLVDEADLAWLITRFSSRAPGTEVLVPVHEGQRGNPVVVSRAVIDAVLADPRGQGLRAWIDAHPERVDRVRAPNDHFTFDLDTPADILRLEARLGRSLGSR
ncbi:MAG: hypothetical protein RIS35_961 [Pseudomonadota bacterium]